MAQAIEIAKSEIERKRKENDNDSMHTSVVGVSSSVRNIKTNHRLSGIHSDIKRWTVNS